MTKTELTRALADATTLSLADARRVIDALFDAEDGIIVAALNAGARVRITGFGTFDTRERSARRGRNPRTGEGIDVPAMVRPTFRAGKGLRRAARPPRRKSKLMYRKRERRRPPPPAPQPQPREPDPDTEMTQIAATGTISDSGEEAESGGGSLDDALDEVSGVSGLGVSPPEQVDIRFTAYHPRKLQPGTWHTLLAYAHVPGALAGVREDRARRLPADEHEEARGGETRTIARGAEITVVPELPGCEFNPPHVRFRWLEDWHRAEFRLRADPGIAGFEAGRAVNGCVAYYVGPLIVAEVKIWAAIGEGAEEAERSEPEEEATAEPYRAVFVSYAHEDATIVDRLEAAYRAIGLKYLRDVRALRSGEKWNRRLLKLIEEADLFQLCWSNAAKASEYVEQEWRHALRQRRTYPFVRPMFWESPMPDPPPELADVHFARYQLD